MTAPDQTNAEVSDERLREIEGWAKLVSTFPQAEGHPPPERYADIAAVCTELIARRSVTSQASEGEVVGWTNLHHLRRFLDGSAENLIVIRNREREWNLPLHLSASDLRFVPKELLPKVSS